MWQASTRVALVVWAIISLLKVCGDFLNQTTQTGGDDLPCAQSFLCTVKKWHLIYSLYSCSSQTLEWQCLSASWLKSLNNYCMNHCTLMVLKMLSQNDTSSPEKHIPQGVFRATLLCLGPAELGGWSWCSAKSCFTTMIFQLLKSPGTEN